MENAARAQADFIMNMYNGVDAAKIPKEVRDVVDYIRHLDGKIEIRETHYKLKDLRDVIYKQVIVLVDREEIAQDEGKKILRWISTEDRYRPCFVSIGRR